jgi:phosphoribosylformylglycinamidine synthase
MNVGVVVFPGSNCDQDMVHAFEHVLGQPTRAVWHKETSVEGLDLVVLPGGFSYGDYLRCGAIAAQSPVMRAVKQFAEAGGKVLGVCNGFQILTEAGLLPGVLLRNQKLKFACKTVYVRVENTRAPFTRHLRVGEVLSLPIAHAEGHYFLDDAGLETLEAAGQVAFRYCTPEGALHDDANPNGAVHHIAGVLNAGGNVLGMMPHPERAMEALLGSTDGLKLLSILAREG